ncbi:MAG: hypothetical protein QM790_18620 [Nibricoccus sp.]
MAQFLEYFADAPALIIAGWALVGMLVVLLFFRKPARLLIAANDSGRLQISRHALHRLLEACCQQVRGVVSARARVARSGGKFKTYLRLKVRPDAKLDAIHGYLAQEITEIYRQNLGIQEVGPIEIEVVGVISEQKEF